MITQLSQTPAGTTDFTLLKDEVTKNSKGLNNITLSNYDNDSAPVVKVGSVFENDGATFEVRTSDESPTGYSGISSSTTFFLYFDASATAFIYDSTAPTWDDAKQGYYHPTNTTDRAFFSMFKDSGGTLYQDKHLLTNESRQQIGDLRTYGQMKWKYYFKDTNVTQQEGFDEFSKLVPNVGDFVSCMGQAKENTSNRLISLSHIYRSASTTVGIRGIGDNNTLSSLGFNDGGGATIEALTIEITVNYDTIS